MQFPDFSDPAVWLSLLTLTVLEIILGVDNIIFISIVSDKLPPAQQKRARFIGLMLAMGFRILLLLTITWIIRLTEPVITIGFLPGDKGELSWKDIILLLGGIFLIGKSTMEIHHKLEHSTKKETNKVYATLGSVIFQIVLVDAVFSFDSILTAIGLVENVVVMIIAVIISIGVMMAFAGVISSFINKHPSLQMLALSFLILIGFMLCAEALGEHISKSYIYTAIAFSLVVEMLNMRLRKNKEPIQLNNEEL